MLVNNLKKSIIVLTSFFLAVGCGGGNTPVPSTTNALSNDEVGDGVTIAKRVVFKTEQHNSFDDSGKKVSTGKIFDDGFYKSGTERSYTKLSGVVKDNITGLEWQDNTRSLKDTYENAQFICSNLNLNGTGWRLPEAEELNTLAIKGKPGTNISTVFENVETAFSTYWTNSVSPIKTKDGALTAWSMNHAGFFTSRSPNINRFEERYIRCVRGKPLPVVGEFEQISSDTLLDVFSQDEYLDKTTDLIWSDSVKDLETRTWSEALNYCKNKGKFVEWRLPSFDELYSLIDRTNEKGVSEKFINLGILDEFDLYWTSTSFPSDPTQAYVISLLNHFSGVVKKTEFAENKVINKGIYAICVRNAN